MPLSAGDKIGPFQVLAPIGAGGMGEVYRARDGKLNREVAIKVLPAALSQDASRMARFEREAQLLAALNHPNIASIYGIEQGAIVMELVEGPDLAGPLPLDTALGFARQIAAALEAAHEKGIIHRDLKPANIKVTPDGVVKLLDFGLAKAAEEPAAAAALSPTISPTLSLGMTQAGGILGTAAYMSPEQARGKAVDKRADIWAFGVVLYEMLTGRSPFVDETVSDTLAHVLTRQVDLAEIPAQVRPLIARCLERDPKKRLRDIGDAWHLLADPSPAPASSTVIAARSPWPWVVTALTVVAALLLLWWTRTPPAAALSHRYVVEGTRGFFFSPDGHWLLSSRAGLKVRAHDAVEWRTLSNTEDADYPFWSPDSTTVGFFSGGRLRSISVQGGDLRNLAAAGAGRGGSWHGGVKDGAIVFATEGKLQSLDVATSQVRTLPIQYPAGTQAELPAFLPESDRFVFLLGGSPDAALYRSSLSAPAGPPEKFLDTAFRVSFARHPHSGTWHIFFSQGSLIVEGYALMTAPIDPRTGDLKAAPVKLISDLATSTGTRLLNFDTADNGMILWRRASVSLPIWRLRWFDRNGNVQSTVGDAGTYVSMALSPDETQLAVMQGYPAPDIWMYDPRSGRGARFSAETGSKNYPLWSPDGRWVYYVLHKDATVSLVRRPAQGGGQIEALSPAIEDKMILLQDMTPDGRYLLSLMANEQGGLGVYRLDLNAPAPRKLELLLARSNDLLIGQQLRLTRDGRWLWLAKDGPGGGYIFPYPPANATPVQFLDYSLRSPFFSKDGRTVYGEILGTGAVPLVVQSILSDAGGKGIRLGAPTTLFTITPPTRVGAHTGAVARDGRILAIASEPSEELKMQVLTDWTTLSPGGQ